MYPSAGTVIHSFDTNFYVYLGTLCMCPSAGTVIHFHSKFHRSFVLDSTWETHKEVCKYMTNIKNLMIVYIIAYESISIEKRSIPIIY